MCALSESEEEEVGVVEGGEAANGAGMSISTEQCEVVMAALLARMSVGARN